MLDLSDRKSCFYWQTDRKLSVDDYGRYFMKRHSVDPEELVSVLQKGIKSTGKQGGISIIDPDENVLKGNVNIVRKVKIGGKEYVARIHPKGIKNGYFYVEKVALGIARKNGLPVPQIIEVHEAENDQDMDFVLMTVSPGITMQVAIEKDPAVEQALLHEAGALLTKVHKIKVEKYGSFDNNIAKDEGRLVGLHETYKKFIWCGLEENVQRLLSFKIIDKNQADMFLEIFSMNDFEPRGGPRLIHNDFADWNILVEGKSISAILDWDECHGGDPVADLACWSTFFDKKRFETFLNGYSLAAQLPADFERRFHYYRLRYTISKMALRVKRSQIDNSEVVQKLINAGAQALVEELDFFNMNK